MHHIAIELEFEQDQYQYQYQYNLSDALRGAASSWRSSEPGLVSSGLISWHGQGAIPLFKPNRNLADAIEYSREPFPSSSLR